MSRWLWARRLALAFLAAAALAVTSCGAEEPYEVVMENMTLGESLPGTAEVEKALSALTLPALSCMVRLENISIGDHASRIGAMVSQREKLDLINTGRTLPLGEMVSRGYLLPLEDLLEEYGPHLLESVGDLLPACTMQGHIYAVPATRYCSSCMGFVYNEAMAAELGVSMKNNTNLRQLEEIAPLLKERGIYLTSQGDGSSSLLFFALFPGFRSVGSSSHLPGVWKKSGGSSSGEDPASQLQSLYDTEEYETYVKLLRRWVLEGWLPSDSILGGPSLQEDFRKGRIFLLWNGVNPLEHALQAKAYPFPVNMTVTGAPAFSTANVQENGWGISSTCENPEKAMAFLDYLYSTPEAANLLMNGIEGRDYVRTGEHILKKTGEGEPQYKRDFTLFGQMDQVDQWEPVTEDFYEELEGFWESSRMEEFFGYTFDLTPVSRQVAAVEKVLEQYLPSLECGMLEDPAEGLARMREALKAAGEEDILEENRRQLRAWLSE